MESIVKQIESVINGSLIPFLAKRAVNERDVSLTVEELTDILLKYAAEWAGKTVSPIVKKPKSAAQKPAAIKPDREDDEYDLKVVTLRELCKERGLPSG